MTFVWSRIIGNSRGVKGNSWVLKLDLRSYYYYVFYYLWFFSWQLSVCLLFSGSCLNASLVEYSSPKMLITSCGFYSFYYVSIIKVNCNRVLFAVFSEWICFESSRWCWEVFCYIVLWSVWCSLPCLSSHWWGAFAGVTSFSHPI